MNVPDPLVRALRTFVQAATGIIVLQAVALAADANDGSLDSSLWKRVIVTALVAGVIAVVTWAHNWFADATGVDPLPK